jgi:hypothetical protein
MYIYLQTYVKWVQYVCTLVVNAPKPVKSLTPLKKKTKSFRCFCFTHGRMHLVHSFPVAAATAEVLVMAVVRSVRAAIAALQCCSGPFQDGDGCTCLFFIVCLFLARFE